MTLEQQAEIIRQQTEAEKTKILAEAEAYKRKIEGYNYQEERKYDILKAAVENENSGMGSLTGELVRLGAGFGVLDSVGRNGAKKYANFYKNQNHFRRAHRLRDNVIIAAQKLEKERNFVNSAGSLYKRLQSVLIVGKK